MSLLYSIRMHAVREGRHLSGAEHIASEENLESLTSSLVARAMNHGRGKAEEIRLTVEALDPASVRRGQLPELTTLRVSDYHQGRRAASRLLEEAGITPGAIRKAMSDLNQGAAPDGGSMRGAMLVDAQTGERLEPDRARGVRASRMDLTPSAEAALHSGLARLGLDNAHVREAIVLAAKVLSTPGIMAELCWSDDPDYTAGYVATPERGYVRFPHLKPLGEERGGRAFFLRPGDFDLDRVLEHLEHSVLLIDRIGVLNGERVWEDGTKSVIADY